MGNVLVCFILIGVLSEVQLVQPEESVKLSCQTSGFTFTSYFLHWIRQVPRKGLVWIGRINPNNGDSEYSQSFQDRFTITRKTSISTGYLQVRDLRTEDTAVYYWAKHDREGESDEEQTSRHQGWRGSE
uniref:Immunoglobulin V-set domain-containing protein n=1 Tax=Sphenodon punctatus TaxID=8508 RepID=A0A8D0GXN1_SPHPU